MWSDRKSTDAFCIGGELGKDGKPARLRGKARRQCLCGGCKPEKMAAHNVVTSQPGFADWAKLNGVMANVDAVAKTYAAGAPPAAGAAAPPPAAAACCCC